MSKHKEFIGDGVYVDYDEERMQVVLTTEDGLSASNTIYLEPEVYDRLVAYKRDVVDMLRKQADRDDDEIEGDDDERLEPLEPIE